jgi:hypothetical protein
MALIIRHFKSALKGRKNYNTKAKGKCAVTPLVLLLLKLEHNIISIGIAYV